MRRRSQLLALLDCPRYLVSSNGNIFFHPDREAMARVILHGGEHPMLCFNYRSPLNEFWDEPVLKARYDYCTEYPRKDRPACACRSRRRPRLDVGRRVPQPFPRGQSGKSARVIRSKSSLNSMPSGPSLQWRKAR